MLARTPRERGAPILSLQVMRGVTALAIGLFHTSIIMAKPEYGGMHAFETATRQAWVSVNFFFVLSGFIILYAHAGDIGRPERIGPYLWRRFSRVYPLYWIVLSVFVAAALLGFGPINFRLAWGDMLSAYTLFRWVPDPQIPLKVAWTLLFEVAFYLMFALAILNRWIGLVAATIWLAGILVASALGSQAMDHWSMWNINFFFGAGAWLTYRHADARLGLPMLAAGLLGLLMLLGLTDQYASIEDQQSKPWGLLLLSLPFWLIVVGAALTEERYRLRFPALLVLFGEASYSIYLVHSAVISGACLVLARLKLTTLPPEVLFVFIFAAAVFAGILTHWALERPLLLAFRRIGLPRGRMLPKGWLRGQASVSR